MLRKWHELDTVERFMLRRRLIILAAATLGTLLVIFLIIMQIKSQMPLYMIGINGLDADSPAQAQRVCRESWERFAEIKQEYGDCEFVWCGKNRLYLLRPYALEEIPDKDNTGFVTVSFFNTSGIKSEGYIIHPELSPRELGIIDLVKTKGMELSFDSVSMSVRVGLREGSVGFDNAVYLWEEGSRKVFAVRAEAVTGETGDCVHFIDDGNTLRECYILDTTIEQAG